MSLGFAIPGGIIILARFDSIKTYAKKICHAVACLPGGVRNVRRRRSRSRSVPVRA